MNAELMAMASKRGQSISLRNLHFLPATSLEVNPAELESEGLGMFLDIASSSF